MKGCLFLLRLFTFALALALASDASRAQEGEIADKSLFYPSRLQTIDGGYIHPTWFSPSTVCSGCHAGIYYQWEGSMHSRAHLDPLYMGLSRMASRETGGLTDTFCSGCHSPLAVAGHEVPPVGNPRMSRQGAEGITCDFCHTIERGLGTGNLPAVLDPGPKKRGPRKDSSSPFHETLYLELATQAEFCGLCHDVSHPLNNLPIERTYTEWKESPYNSGDPASTVYCQDCHMRQIPGTPSTGMTKRPNNRGKSASMGPWRDNVFTHYFVGGNAAMTSVLKSEAHRALARERLGAAATLEIVGATAGGGKLSFSVRVTNSGAGHYLPTGLTEAREMWLEVAVLAPDGRVLQAWGTLDEAGKIRPDTVLYHTTLADAEGRPTVKVWEAAGVIQDRRIAPLQHDDASFTVRTERVKGKLTIRARLLYRSFPPALAELAMGQGASGAEPVEMTATETTVEMP